jgi:sugar phosphate isomerase/epimerase
VLSVGFRTAGFHKWPIHRALAEIGQLGYDGVELCLEHPDCRPEALTAARCEQLASCCRNVGLGVASVSYHADNEPWEARRENVVRAIDLVRPLGTDILIINGRRADPPDQSQALDDLVSLLEVLLVRAAELGVRVAVEPEPGLAVGTSQEAQELLDRFGSPHLGVNLDVGHAFLTDEDVCATVRLLGPAIFHTHFEGMPADQHRHLLPGQGEIDLVSICRALRGVGYRGYCTVDLFAIADDPSGWAGRALSAMHVIVAEAEVTP